MADAYSWIGDRSIIDGEDGSEDLAASRACRVALQSIHAGQRPAAPKAAIVTALCIEPATALTILAFMKQDAPQVLWVPQEVFWDRFDGAGVLIDYQEWCVFHATEEEIQQRIGIVPPNHNLTGEEDQPGPVSRWYGYLADIPILLDHHQFAPKGPVVVIRHGRQPHARSVLRDFFKSWGRGWDDSSLPVEG